VFWETNEEFCVLSNEATSPWVGWDYGFATTEMTQMSVVACEVPSPESRVSCAAC
jgi:hypothetical protein